MSATRLLHQRHDIRIEFRGHDSGERVGNARSHCGLPCVAIYIDNASLDEVAALKRMDHAGTNVFLKESMNPLRKQNVDW
jgi:hypothetical protein